MLKLRLIRIGRRNDPHFRIVAQDIKRAPKGKYTELLGNYAPLQKKRTISKERVLYWLSKGAVPTDTLWNMFVSEGIIKGARRPVHAKAKNASPSLRDGKKGETALAGEGEKSPAGA